MKIAIIEKAPSKNDYGKYINAEFELLHMSSVPLPKLLKKDVDLVVDLSKYDLVILVGSEAAKEYAKVTNLTNMAGQLINDKFICMPNPAMLYFKPEGKPAFDKVLKNINGYIEGSTDLSLADIKIVTIDDSKEAMDYLLQIKESKPQYLSIDTEGTALYPRDGYVLGISFAYKPQEGAYISTDCLEDEHIAIIQELIDTTEIVMHNMKYDIKMLEYHFPLRFRRNHIHDTILLHYVLDENSEHGLKALALLHTKYGDYDAALDTFKKEYCRKHGILEEEFTYDLIPFDILSTYAAKDAAVTLELFHKFFPIVSGSQKLYSVYTNILLPGSHFLNEMEEVGIPINKERMEAAEKFLDSEINIARQDIYKYEVVTIFEKDTNTIFNPNSVFHLRKVLFDYLGLTPTGKLTDTGEYSTAAAVLEELVKEHPFPGAILKIKQLTKIKNTYLSKILPQLDKDGRIRTSFNIIATTSGRLSSSGKFNAQQIPRDDPIVKACIQAIDGYKIVSQDLRTGEMYYAAVLSGDKALQSVFLTGGDFHSAIAKMVFDLDCSVEDVKKYYPEFRQSAKAISFGILYGSGAEKVSQTVSDATGKPYGVRRAAEDIDAYFKKFSKLKKWLNERKEFISVNGYTYSFFGRKRRLVNVFSKDKGIAAHAIRSGINAEVQSLCSDINLLAAIDTANELKMTTLDAKIFMLVHDSIVAVVKDEHVEEYSTLLRNCTQKDRGCSIKGSPIGVDLAIGQDYSFGHFEEIYKLDGNILSRV